jgi:hypothetical protein
MAEIINLGQERDTRRPIPTTDNHISFVALSKGEPEWERAWAWLKQIEEATFHYDIFAIAGEQWQYMGSEYLTAAVVADRGGGRWMAMRVADGISGAGYYHNFRIRWHPINTGRVYRLIAARDGWKPNYENVMAGNGWMNSIKDAVEQMKRDYPELLDPHP